MTSQPGSALSIEQLHNVNSSQRVKDWVGRVLASVQPGLARDLFRAPTVNPSGLVSRAIMFHLRRRAVEEERHGFLARLHRDFWASENGAEFSGNCDHRFEDLFLAKQQVDFRALQEALVHQPCSRIVELGANSGLLLQHLTTKLDGIESATGIDINQAQVERNLASGRFDPRIEFLCADGQKWVTENAQPSTLFVTNGGVLEYFRREKLDAMMRHIADHAGPSIFYCSEPFADDHDFGSVAESIPFGEEISFSHNYRDLFEKNGFEVLHQRAVHYESWRMQATIAITPGRRQ
ncbi:MAG: hypothetical protein Aurels2KO_33620 [Aureliella sp.]